ncbi:MAG: hypothetical protein AB1468_01190 [Candidatus Micrarchaeota archaeon]
MRNPAGLVIEIISVLLLVGAVAGLGPTIAGLVKTTDANVIALFNLIFLGGAAVVGLALGLVLPKLEAMVGE